MNAFKRARSELGYSQECMAKILNVSQQAISKWEKGNCKPRVSTLKKLADLLNCTVDELLKETG